MSQTYSAAEVSSHCKESDLWIVYKKKVYDVTKYVDEHPGGLDTLLEVAGKDATDSFDSVGHSKEAKETLSTFHIGELDANDVAQLPSSAASGKNSYSSLAIIAVLLAICVYFIVS